MVRKYIDISGELLTSMLTTGDVTSHVKRLWITEGLPDSAYLVSCEYIALQDYVRLWFADESFTEEGYILPTLHQEYDDA